MFIKVCTLISQFMCFVCIYLLNNKTSFSANDVKVEGTTWFSNKMHLNATLVENFDARKRITVKPCGMEFRASTFWSVCLSVYGKNVILEHNF